MIVGAKVQIQLISEPSLRAHRDLSVNPYMPLGVLLHRGWVFELQVCAVGDGLHRNVNRKCRLTAEGVTLVPSLIVDKRRATNGDPAAENALRP